MKRAHFELWSRYRSSLFAVGCAGATTAAVPVALLFNFTVDDALISARYAHHLAIGFGYRFNAMGSVTDGVTPLGWAHVLAPFAKSSTLDALRSAKWLGAVLWLLSSGVVAATVARVASANGPLLRLRPAYLVWLLVCGSAPLAAWSASGMETGLVLALAALSVASLALGCPLAAAALSGVCAGLRPELLPWSLCMGAASSCRKRKPARSAQKTLLSMSLSAAPFAIAATVRRIIFLSWAPLSLTAKPGTLVLGAQYSVACLLLTGALAVFAPLAVLKMRGWQRWVCASVLVHAGAVTFAGGDWMPLSRLFVPVLPCVAVGAAMIGRVAPSPFHAIRLVLALLGEAWVWKTTGASAAHVMGTRMAIISELRPLLASSKVVASVDIGLVGASFGGTVVDLAGVTDPNVAVLHGGHTTKRIPVQLLDARQVDTLVFRIVPESPAQRSVNEATSTPSQQPAFAYGVEGRVIAQHDGEYRPVGRAESGSLAYLVLKR